MAIKLKSNLSQLSLPELIENYWYRTIQLLFNLITAILIPLGTIYTVLGLLAILKIIPSNQYIRYFMLVLLLIHSIIVILFSFSYCKFGVPEKKINYNSFICVIGWKIYDIRYYFYRKYLYIINILWCWFIAPFALSVTCKLLNVFQEGWWTYIYYGIYLIALVISDDSNTEQYNSYD